MAHVAICPRTLIPDGSARGVPGAQRRRRPHATRSPARGPWTGPRSGLARLPASRWTDGGSPFRSAERIDRPAGLLEPSAASSVRIGAQVGAAGSAKSVIRPAGDCWRTGPATRPPSEPTPGDPGISCSLPFREGMAGVSSARPRAYASNLPLTLWAISEKSAVRLPELA